MNEIASGIIYVGVHDGNIDLFEGQYPLTRGISYNSYIIGSTAVIDSVDSRFARQWINNIRLTGIEPQMLIVQHMEPDHSGSIEAFVSQWPDAKIVCSAKAAAMLPQFFENIDFSGRIITVANGDTLTAGTVTLRFFSAPMVHWPEVMVTLAEPQGVLFSADAFGTFDGIDGSTDPALWAPEARRYFTNIVGKFGASVQTLMKKLTPLKFSVVAPLHGPVLTGNIAPYWQLYDKWSRYEPECKGTLVAYASVYGGTAEAARSIANELRSVDPTAAVEVVDLCRTHVSEALSLAFKYGSMVLCSITYDGDIFPAMHTFIHHLCAKKVANRRIALVENGSWAPVAARIMASELASLPGVLIVNPTLTVKSRLHRADLATVATLASNICGATGV